MRTTACLLVGTQWQRDRNGKRVVGLQPLVGVTEPEPAGFAGSQYAHTPTFISNLELDRHGFQPRVEIQTSRPSRSSTLRTSPKRALGFPLSTSPRKRGPTPIRSAVVS